MQNFIYKSKNTFKLLDIRSERLYREAEDCFFYFNKPKRALTKLKTALQYCPNHYKSLVLSGDIYFIQGCFKQALKNYSKACVVQPFSSRAFASVANALNELGLYSEAYIFCENAFNLLDFSDAARVSSLYELKISVLTNQKKYREAKRILEISPGNFENLKVLKQLKLPYLNEKIRLKTKLTRSCIHPV